MCARARKKKGKGEGKERKGGRREKERGGGGGGQGATLIVVSNLSKKKRKKKKEKKKNTISWSRAAPAEHRAPPPCSAVSQTPLHGEGCSAWCTLAGCSRSHVYTCLFLGSRSVHNSRCTRLNISLHKLHRPSTYSAVHGIRGGHLSRRNFFFSPPGSIHAGSQHHAPPWCRKKYECRKFLPALNFT